MELIPRVGLACLNSKVATMSKEISILIITAGRRVELVKAFIESSKKFKDLNIKIFTNKERTEFLGIELNPRFGAGYPMSHIAGAEFPLMLIKEYLLNEKLFFNNNWKTNLLCLRHDVMVVKSLEEDTVVL